MIVMCPKCGQDYEITENQLKSSKFIKCIHCGYQHSSKSIALAEGIILEEDNNKDNINLDLPAPSQKKGKDLFDDLDLPAPSQKKGKDLFGDLDLPAPSQKKGKDLFGDLDLPAPSQKKGKDLFGDLDLPAPSQKKDKDLFGDLDLPAPSQKKDKDLFGDLDLPTPSQDKDLFGMMDLPDKLNQGKDSNEIEEFNSQEKESSKDIFNNFDINSNMFSNNNENPFNNLDLQPTTINRKDDEIPASLLLDVSNDDNKEQITGNSSEYEFSNPIVDNIGSKLDSEYKNKINQMDLPAPIGLDLPAKKDNQKNNSDDEIVLQRFESINSGEDQEFSAIPEEKESKNTDSEEFTPVIDDGKVDIDQDIYTQAKFDKKTEKEKPDKEKNKEQLKLSIPLWILLISILLISCVGIVLGFTDYGIFGYEFIMERLPNKEERSKAINEINKIKGMVKNDTSKDLNNAINKLNNYYKQNPRQKELRGYLLFLINYSQIRFGQDRYKLEAQRLSQKLNREEPNIYEKLALSTDEFLKNQLGVSENLAKIIFQSDTNQTDALALQGEINLLSKQYETALNNFNQLCEKEKNSTRCLFGKSRVLIKLNKKQEALELLKNIATNSPEHIGTYLLLTKIFLDEKNINKAKTVINEINTKNASNKELSDYNKFNGDINLYLNNIEKAKSHYEKGIENYDKNLENYIGLGKIFIEQKDYVAALAQYKIALSYNPDNIDAQLGSSRCLLSTDINQPLKAKEIIDGLKNNNLDNPEVYLLSGQIEEKTNGDISKAEEYYRKTIEIDRNNYEGYINLANILQKEKRAEEALKLLSTAYEKNPASKELNLTISQVLLNMDKLDEAQQKLVTFLDTNQDNPDGLFLLGITLRKLKRYDESKILFDRLNKINKRYPGLSLERGVIFEQLGDTNNAINMYREALKEYPDNLDIKTRLGSVLVNTNQGEDAANILDEVLKIRPLDHEANYYMGRALILQKKNADAKLFLQQSVLAEPSNPIYHYYYGLVSLETNDYNNALTEFNKSIEFNPEFPDVYFKRGILMYKLGSMGSALRDLQKALRMNSKLYEANAYLGIIYEMQQETHDAIQNLRIAVQNIPDDGKSRQLLGTILCERGERTECLRYLSDAIKIGKMTNETSNWYLESLYEYGKQLYLRGNKNEAIPILREFISKSPTESVERAEIERIISRGGN